MSGKVRIGVIGIGSISDLHLQSYLKNDAVELAAICDVNGEHAALKAKSFGAGTTYTDYRDLLADPTIDGVSICTWNNTHAEISIAALKADSPIADGIEMMKILNGVYRSAEAEEEIHL
jgi:predicted dehydrogenase